MDKSKSPSLIVSKSDGEKKDVQQAFLRTASVYVLVLRVITKYLFYVTFSRYYFQWSGRMAIQIWFWIADRPDERSIFCVNYQSTIFWTCLCSRLEACQTATYNFLFLNYKYSRQWKISAVLTSVYTTVEELVRLRCIEIIRTFCPTYVTYKRRKFSYFQLREKYSECKMLKWQQGWINPRNFQKNFVQGRWVGK